MKTREFFITMRDGQVVNRECLKKQIVSLPDGRFVFKIEDKRKRSLPQNAYYWSCVVPLVKDGLRDAGYDDVKTDEDAHEVMKNLFLRQQIASEKKGGEVLEFTRSTAQLTKEMFSEYLESIWKWAAEFLGVVIPNPGEPIEIFSP